MQGGMVIHFCSSHHERAWKEFFRETTPDSATAVQKCDHLTIPGLKTSKELYILYMNNKMYKKNMNYATLAKNVTKLTRIVIKYTLYKK